MNWIKEARRILREFNESEKLMGRIGILLNGDYEPDPEPRNKYTYFDNGKEVVNYL